MPKFPSGEGTGFVNQHVETTWVRVPPSAPSLKSIAVADLKHLLVGVAKIPM